MEVKLLAATRAYRGSKNGLISFQLDYPLYVHTELLTHRRLCRNASSARAMGTERYIGMGYYTPSTFFKQGKGMMSSNDPIQHQRLARFIWNSSTKLSMFAAKLLERLEVAKEQRNRLIPPNKIIRAIVTGTENGWKSFLALRNHHEADKAMCQVAYEIQLQIQKLYYEKTTHIIPSGQPLLIDPTLTFASGVPYSGSFVFAGRKETEIVDNWTYDTLHNPYPQYDSIESIIAAIARVSYARTKGKDDQALFNQLLESGHMSPFEHVAIWTLAPYSSCLTTKNEDIVLDPIRGHAGWQTFRSDLEHTTEYSDVIADYNSLLTHSKNRDTLSTEAKEQKE